MIDQSIRVENGSEIIIKLNEIKKFTHIGTVGSYSSFYMLDNDIINNVDSSWCKWCKWCKKFNLYYRNEQNKNYIYIGKFNGNVSDHDFKLNDLRQYINYYANPIKYLKLVPIIKDSNYSSINMSIGLYDFTNKFAYDEVFLEKLNIKDSSHYVKYDIIIPDIQYA